MSGCAYRMGLIIFRKFHQLQEFAFFSVNKFVLNRKSLSLSREEREKLTLIQPQTASAI